MDYQRRMKSFAARWNIPVEEEEFRRFTHRFAHLLANSTKEYIASRSLEERYCFLLGEPDEYDRWGSIASNALWGSSDLAQFVLVLQRILWIIEDYDDPPLDDLVVSLREAIRISQSIGIRVARRGNRVTLYPAGAKLLDEKIVNENLVWLEGHPQVAKTFEEALKIYQSGDAAKYRNLLDNLRHSVEQLLKAVLKNQKPIEKQRDLLLPWLRSQGVHQQVVNMYCDLLDRFALYQNDAVKHNEKWVPAEVEFMIYLTGTFMRLLLQLENGDA